MANTNAFIIKPLPVISAAARGTVIVGEAGHLFNDYAGVVLHMNCDAAGNQARVDFDFGRDVAIDTIVIFGLDLLPAAATLGIRYATQAQGYFTGAAGSGGSAAAYAGTERQPSGKGVSLWMADAPVTARYVSLDFSAGGSGQQLRAARIVAGLRFQPDRNFSYGAGLGARDLGNVDWSRRGVMLRQRGARLRTAALTFSNAYKDEVERRVLPLIETAGNTEPVALVVDPQPDARREGRCYFGTLTGDLSAIRRNAAAWEWKASLVGPF